MDKEEKNDKNIIQKILDLYKKETSKICYEIILEEEEPDILDDKICGKPYIPIGEEYPKDKKGNNLALLLQVNLKNIELKNFPKTGILEIFTSSVMCSDLEYQVKCYEEGKEYQEELPEIDKSKYLCKVNNKIKLRKTVDYMSNIDYRYPKTILKVLNEMTKSNFRNIEEAEKNLKINIFDFEKKIPKLDISLGGYPDFTQDDPRPLNGREECLFKLDSNARKDIRIGDSGILYSFISKKDLKKGNFNDVYLSWDCL